MDAPSSLGSKEPRQVNEVGVHARLEKTPPSIYSQSIFTGLNNLDIYSILENKFSRYLGFTQREVEDLLNFYGLLQTILSVNLWRKRMLSRKTRLNDCFPVRGVEWLSGLPRPLQSGKR